uniref:Uncharacterized protein n=1 Tax=Anguilla anguilla TaxID=7936 RepID=A0A0E9XEX5_ANGAN
MYFLPLNHKLGQVAKIINRTQKRSGPLKNIQLYCNNIKCSRTWNYPFESAERAFQGGCCNLRSKAQNTVVL